MPETYGRPSLGSNFIARWVAMEAAEQRGHDEYAPIVGDDEEPVEQEPIAGQRRSRVTADKIARVIA